MFVHFIINFSNLIPLLFLLFHISYILLYIHTNMDIEITSTNIYIYNTIHYISMCIVTGQCVYTIEILVNIIFHTDTTLC